MPKYTVPVIVEISGEVTVEADNLKDALVKAKEIYKGIPSIEAPCYQTDFAYGDDLGSIEPEEDGLEEEEELQEED
jgi:hypothetical protein